jgi:hypothetical protein
MQSPTMLTPPLKKGLTPKGACANHSLKWWHYESLMIRDCQS